MRVDVRTWILSAGAAAALAACSRGPAVQDLRVSRQALRLGGAVARYEMADSGDALGLYDPADLRVVDGRIAVVERGSGRLSLLTPRLERVAAAGTAGRGPGQLTRPSRVRTWNSLLAVGEASLQRISFFRRDGSFSHVRLAPVNPISFDLDGRGNLFVPTRDGRYHLVRIDSAGQRVGFGTRVPSIYGKDDLGEDGALLFSGGDLVAVGARDEVYVFDNQAGVLHTYAPDGTLAGSMRLPGELLRELKSYRKSQVAQVEAATGQHVVFAPLVKDMTVLDSNTVALTLTGKGPCAALVHLAQGELQLVEPPTSSTGARDAQRAKTIALAGNTAVTLTDHGIAVYVMSRSDR